MADNAQKTPLGLSLNRLAERKISDAISRLGQALPCRVTAVDGQIVTVAFELNAVPFTLPQVEMPIVTWLYDWIPVQVGTLGLTFPASVYLGGVSGLGGGTAGLSQPANLSALMFVPVSNSSWQPPGGDPNKRVVQGPTGVLLQDLAAVVSGLFDKSNGITFSFGSATIMMTATDIVIQYGTTSITLNGTSIVFTAGGKTVTLSNGGFDLDGVLWETHEHTGVTAGSSNTGGPVAP